ncbi:GumC family protein [Uliginosibacterium sediminicola]|uniref:GNVR domain-containing protein n=1 Tax=Uliginosibacterium sediminicola TaxID=2024550 RepID=A0ABU9Z438_9RHOO
MTTHTTSEPLRDTDEDEIHILDIVLVLARHKRILWMVPCLFVLVAIIYAFVSTPLYEARTSVLPPQQQSSGALSQLGGLAAVAGGSLGLKNPNDLYIAMLKSRDVGVSLIQRFKLQERYETRSRDDTLRALEKVTLIDSGKDGLINIAVTDPSPDVAASIANAYVDELRRVSKTLAVTEAAQRRLFFETQLRDTRKNLSDAEISLKQLQQKTGLLQLEAQGKVAIDATANLRAQIAARQVELVAMKNYATEQNPAVQRLRGELEALQSQLRQMERNGSDDALFSRQGMPEAGIEYVRKTRELKYQEMLYELLSRQYEIAKLDEAKDGANIQVLDKAVPPERKSKPKRTMIVLLALFAGVFLGLVLAFIREALQRLKSSPSQRSRLDEIRSALKA